MLLWFLLCVDCYGISLIGLDVKWFFGGWVCVWCSLVGDVFMIVIILFFVLWVCC